MPITYHAVWSAVDKLSKSFDLKYPGSDYSAIRSHSGRATCITAMMGEGVPLAISMNFARHKPGSQRVHLAYGRLSVADVHQAVERTRRAKKGATSSKDSAAAQGKRRQAGLLPVGLAAQPSAKKPRDEGSCCPMAAMREIVQWQADGFLTMSEALELKKRVLAGC